MKQDENDFLRELQEACLKEVEDYLNDFREILSVFKDDPLSGIEQLQKVIHSMKGNLQAVAFLQFGNYVHDLETILDAKSKAIVAPSGKRLPDFEILVFEYLLSSILEGMEGYVRELKNSYLDSEEFVLARKEFLNGLQAWEPKFEAVDAPMFTPVDQIKDHQPDIDSLLSGTNSSSPLTASSAPPQQPSNVIELEMPDTGGFQMIEPNLDLIAELTEKGLVPEVAAETAATEVPPAETPPAPAPVTLELVVDNPTPPELDLSALEAPSAVVEVPAPSASTVASSVKPKGDDDSGKKNPSAWKNYRGSGLFLLFQNHKKYFAIAIEHIVEVIKSQPLSSPPHKRKNLRGLLNLRGEILPILNVDAITTDVEPRSTYVVVSQVDDMRFGFQVESVHQVVTLDPKQFQSVDGLSEDNGSGIVTHFCQTEDKTISILKLNELVAA